MKSKLNKFMGRTLTSVVLIAVLAAFMCCGYFISPIFIEVLVWIFMAGASIEMYKCLRNSGYNFSPLPFIVMLVASYPVYLAMQLKANSGGVYGLLIVTLVSVMLALVIFTFEPDRNKEEDEVDVEDPAVFAMVSGVKEEIPPSEQRSRLSNLFASIFMIIYPMLFLGAAWVLSGKYCAFFAILFAIFVPIIGSDMFAYFVGSLIGGKKLCPSISPKKTVAGAIGGIIGSIIVSLVFWAIFEMVSDVYGTFDAIFTPFVSHDVDGWEWKTAFIYMALGAICGVVSELGDLAASRIKRELFIKDFGKALPGHGGFMDRIDSVMYCLVVLLIAFPCIYGV